MIFLNSPERTDRSKSSSLAVERPAATGVVVGQLASVACGETSSVAADLAAQRLQDRDRKSSRINLFTFAKNLSAERLSVHRGTAFPRSGILFDVARFIKVSRYEEVVAPRLPLTAVCVLPTRINIAL